ncbi:dipeptidase [Bradyrhizobium xenonodulans]|uniref:Dipeptidase n=1 Tax=Bradyrhizobium xenonodulans TaxID=2736875 RepID=A0ABY7MHR0_9BRAD|nr:membrane dipeptidase [Bradyrhizobium xenonodulans]WBL77908.1 dipeptidase [Bradyrhizobium xenonodulans]
MDDASRPDRLEQIHQQTVFVDVHAHPSGFCWPGVPRIGSDELDRYRRSLMDLVVCSLIGDATYSCVKRDESGRYTPGSGANFRGRYRPKPGEAFAFDLDRLSAILKTIEDGDAALADSPAAVRAAKREGKLALMPALEGADSLEGLIDNLHELHRRGLRLLQLVHMRANEVGHVQTFPYSPGGLTPFGREVVRECNELGIVIDLAHANTETIMDTLALSSHPVICSHTGVQSLYNGQEQTGFDRFLTDEEIRAIAAKGGVIGMILVREWMPHLSDLMRHCNHIRRLVGIDHLGIGSDLVRGVGSASYYEYMAEFGVDANFRAIADGLLAEGYSVEEVGKVMGGNFFRVWEQVAGAH